MQAVPQSVKTNSDDAARAHKPHQFQKWPTGQGVQCGLGPSAGTIPGSAWCSGLPCCSWELLLL